MKFGEPTRRREASRVRRFAGLFGFKLRSDVLQDCFGSKYVTAQLFDPLVGWLPFAIRPRNISADDFLFYRIGDRMLILRGDPDRVYTYRQPGARPIQTILYSLADWSPIDLAENDCIEKFCEANNIESIDSVAEMIISAANQLQAEPSVAVSDKDVVAHLLVGLPENSAEYARKAADYYKAIRDLGGVPKLGPMAAASKYLGRRMRNNPATLANLITSLGLADFEFRSLSNPAKRPFRHWGLVLLLFGGLAAAVVAGIFVADPTLLGAGDAGDIVEQFRQLQEAGITPESVGVDVDALDTDDAAAAGGAPGPDDLFGLAPLPIDDLFGAAVDLNPVADLVGGSQQPATDPAAAPAAGEDVNATSSGAPAAGEDVNATSSGAPAAPAAGEDVNATSSGAVP